MRCFAVAGLLTLSSLSPAMAELIPGTEFTSGNWTGAAYTDDQGGFAYCDAWVSYTDDRSVWLVLYNDDTLTALLSHPEVRFRPGETFDSWLMLEVGLPTRGTSEAWNEYYAGMTLAGIDPSIDFLVQGQWLRLLGIGIDDSFDVSGMPEALAAARACHQRNSGSNPFATAEPKPTEPAPEPALGTPKPMPKVPDLKPKTGTVGSGGGLGTRPGGALGTPAPLPSP